MYFRVCAYLKRNINSYKFYTGPFCFTNDGYFVKEYHKREVIGGKVLVKSMKRRDETFGPTD